MSTGCEAPEQYNCECTYCCLDRELCPEQTHSSYALSQESSGGIVQANSMAVDEEVTCSAPYEINREAVELGSTSCGKKIMGITLSTERETLKWACHPSCGDPTKADWNIKLSTPSNSFKAKPKP